MAAMGPRQFLRFMVRESRGSRGRLLFFVACLSVGVAAVVAVAGLAASLDAGIRGEARQLLAADLAVEGNQPLPEPPEDASLSEALEAIEAQLGGRPIERTDLRELVTVVAAPVEAAPAGVEDAPEAPPGPSQLVELKVVDGPYPFYGTLTLEPARPLAELLGPSPERPVGGAVVGPELLAELGLAVGDDLKVGAARVPIAGVVTAEPDRMGTAFGFAIGPRVFLGPEAFAAADLTGAGSRVRYRLLLRLPDEAGRGGARRAAEALKAALPEAGAYRVETWAEAQPALRQGIDQVERFLGLVALLSLLVGGIGVGQTVRAWLAGRMDAIAVLKCLGMRPRQVLALYLGQTALLGLAGSLVGMAVGVAVQLLTPSLLGDLVPRELLDPWQPGALARGLALGVGVALLFGGPPLSAVLRVPPARVLRRSVQPLAPPLWALVGTGFLVIAGVWGLAALQSGSPWLGLWFTLGCLGATLALALAAWLLVRLTRAIPRERRWLTGRFWLRHGLAALGRPGAATLSAVVALGLGVLVVLGMWLVERGLAAELAADLPAQAPSVFLVDIQPDQWPEVRTILEEEGAERIDSVPVITARLTAVEGEGVGELSEEARSEEDGGRRWALTREQRLTYMDALPEDNVVTEGALWQDPEAAEVSVEADFARDLDIGLGSVLTFDVQGVPLELRVTSLRTVDWGTFGINFFLVVEPGVLENAPQQRIAAVRLPAAAEDPTRDRLAARFPNVTLLPIREILDKVVAILDRITFGIRFLGGFTVLAGVVILAGAVSAGSLRRGREAALLKALGSTRLGVVAVYSVEYALVGLVAGLIGTAGGVALSWAVLTRGMEVPWTFDPLPVAVALGGSVLVTVAAGLVTSLRALERRPIEALRSE